MIVRCFALQCDGFSVLEELNQERVLSKSRSSTRGKCNQDFIRT